MSAHHPGVRFSICPNEGRWRWRATQGERVLAEGVAPTRAAAAAFVIREICRACAIDAAVAKTATLAEAA